MNGRYIRETCGLCQASIVLIQSGRRGRIRLGMVALLHTMQHRIMPLDVMQQPAGQRIWKRWTAS